MTKAFDLAHFVPAALPNVGDTVVVATPNPLDTAWASSGAIGDAPIDGQLYGRLNAAWAQVSASFLPLAGGTVTGVVIFPGNNSVVVQGANATTRSILGRTGPVTRWQLQLGDSTAEAGGNVGSNFSLTAFSNVGGFLSTPLFINRASGLATVAGDPVAALGIATKQYVDANAGGGGLPEAPLDGTSYLRANGTWVNVVDAGAY